MNSYEKMVYEVAAAKKELGELEKNHKAEEEAMKIRHSEESKAALVKRWYAMKALRDSGECPHEHVTYSYVFDYHNREEDETYTCVLCGYQSGTRPAGSIVVDKE